MTPARPADPDRHQAGFTLLECIVALVLTSLMLSMLSLVTRQWLLSWDIGAKRAEEVETLALASTRIVDDLEHIVVLPNSRPLPVPVFKGTEDQIFFINTGNGPGSVGLYSIALTASHEGGVVRSAQSLVDSSANEAIPLLPAIDHVEFAYRKEAGAWQPRWNDALLPHEIRITITRPDATSNGNWSFTVPVHAPWPAPCAHVPEFKDCLMLAQGQQSQAAQTPSPDPAAPEKPTNPQGAGP